MSIPIQKKIDPITPQSQSRITIHFGRCLAQNIYDHNINNSAWQNLLSSLKCNHTFIPTLINKKYKVYHYDSLIYEFDLETGDYQCFTDNIDNVQILKLSGNNAIFETSLVYGGKRLLVDADFQPINRYYNIYELERSVYTNDITSIILEKKGDKREIKVVINSGDWSLIESQLKLFIFLDGYQLNDINFS